MDVAVLSVPDESLYAAEPAAAAELSGGEPCLITFTSGTAGEPKGVLHAQRYLYGQQLQAEHWLAPAPGELVWCTAASGWSKSARNVFIAPWLRGAAALLHDARFDPHERLELLERERVARALHGPHRVPRDRQARHAPGAAAAARHGRGGRGAQPGGAARLGGGHGPADPRRLRADGDRPADRGAGPTQQGSLDGEPRPGSMGPALPGIGLTVREGELMVDPASVPTFFLGYLGEQVSRGEDGAWRVEDRREGMPWATGDRVSRDEDGWLYFEGRGDDVIVSAGYRIGPFEVESALVAHPAVAEAAAVAAPDEERGSVVRAVVVLRDGFAPGAELAAELQEHVKSVTAPYKYPRIVDFAEELPKTASGKVKRAELRRAGS